jgi:hypothetical protein
VKQPVFALIAFGTFGLACEPVEDLDVAEESAALISPSTIYRIASRDSGLCFDVPYGNYFDGAPVNQYYCHTRTNQHWTIQGIDGAVPGGVIASTNRAWCVAVASASNKNLVLRPCNWRYPGTLSQLWTFSDTPDTNDVPRIRNRMNSECIDVPSGSNSTGVQMQTFPCHTGLNQQWLLMPWVIGG